MIHLDRAYAQMEQLKVESLVDDSLDMHFKEVACNEWNEAKREEYLAQLPKEKTAIIYCKEVKESIGGSEVYVPKGCTLTYEQWIGDEV